MFRKTAFAAAAAACLVITAPAPVEAGAALDSIKQRGTLR